MRPSVLAVKQAYREAVESLKVNQARLTEILDAIERRDISADEVRNSLYGVAMSLRDARKKIYNEKAL